MSRLIPDYLQEIKRSCNMADWVSLYRSSDFENFRHYNFRVWLPRLILLCVNLLNYAMSCRQRKIQVDLQLSLSESILPEVYQPIFLHQQHGHSLYKSNKPLRVRRQKKRAESRQSQSVWSLYHRSFYDWTPGFSRSLMLCIYDLVWSYKTLCMQIHSRN